MVQEEFKKIYHLPQIAVRWEKDARHALVVMPFYGPDATSMIINDMCRELKKQGYTVHALLYNSDEWKPNNDLWDYVYHLEAKNKNFGKPAFNIKDGAGLDGNKLDEWAGEELQRFIGYLSGTVDIEICIVNYVFLSRAFLGLKQSTHKLLYTIDIFAGRNTRMAAVGVSESGYYFSTTEEEEVKGLSRADIVIAIQDEEAVYFSSLVGENKVNVLPPVLQKHYLSLRKSDNFVIGYIGSGHRPNVDALLEFVRCFDFSCGAELVVGGSICNALGSYALPSQVRLHDGYIYDLESFYEGCNLMINPDMLKSGMKIKCLEALSFGSPLVCTKAASTGIGLKDRFHNASSISICTDLVKEIVLCPSLLEDLAQKSRKSYDDFCEKYSFAKTFERYAVEAAQKMSRHDA